MGDANAIFAGCEGQREAAVVPARCALQVSRRRQAFRRDCGSRYGRAARVGQCSSKGCGGLRSRAKVAGQNRTQNEPQDDRSEEHTSELQSPCNLVCRLLLEKKKQYTSNINKRITHTQRS